MTSDDIRRQPLPVEVAVVAIEKMVRCLDHGADGFTLTPNQFGELVGQARFTNLLPIEVRVQHCKGLVYQVLAERLERGRPEVELRVEGILLAIQALGFR